MRQYFLTPKARNDLELIWAYTKENWGVSQAETYLQSIRKTLEGLADGSVISQPADQIRKGYRKTPSGSHIIFFKENNDTVNVIRILHQRMHSGRL